LSQATGKWVSAKTVGNSISIMCDPQVVGKTCLYKLIKFQDGECL
jgi:hypothetical protein